MTDKNFKIFIVDDNEIFLKAISKKIVDTTEASVETFTSAEECLKSLEKEPDLILSDYYLDADFSKKMNGDKFLEHVKKELPDVPVIIYSSQESVEVAVGLIKKGAAEYLPKDKDAVQKISTSTNHIIQNLKHRYSSRERRYALYVFLASVLFFNLLIVSINATYEGIAMNFGVGFILSLIFGLLMRAAYRGIKKVYN